MQEAKRTSSLGDRVLGTATIWRLAQIVLVLAAAYLYFFVGSFGAMLQRQRLFFEPHTPNLLRLIAVGVGIGLCIGLALKDFTRGQVVFSPDWPTLVINLVGAGAFALVALGLNVSAINNTPFMTGPIKNAVVVSPLLPFVWAGLALTALVRPKPPTDDSVVTMAP